MTAPPLPPPLPSASTSARETLLDVAGLSVSFPTPDGSVRAVVDASFEVGRGEILGIVGESGSGKTTLLMAVARLLDAPGVRVEAERVCLGGRELQALSDREFHRLRGAELSVVFQDATSALNPTATIGRQIGETLRAHRSVSRKAATAEAVRLLELLGVPDAARRSDSYAHELSGGLRQRVMIASAIAARPSLLLADEPTTALDVTVQAGVVDLVVGLRDALNMAVVWISHDLPLLATFADRVAVMYAGRIIEVGPSQRVFDTPGHPYTVGLLESIPQVKSAAGGRLTAMPGSLPSPTDYPTGCPFADRCAFRMDVCAEMPTFRSVAPGHVAACWLLDEGRDSGDR